MRSLVRSLTSRQMIQSYTKVLSNPKYTTVHFNTELNKSNSTILREVIRYNRNISDANAILITILIVNENESNLKSSDSNNQTFEELKSRAKVLYSLLSIKHVSNNPTLVYIAITSHIRKKIR